MYLSQLLASLAISLALTLLLELIFALFWGVGKDGLLVVVLMNILTNPAVVILHFLFVTCMGWSGWLPVLLLELAAMVVEGICCRGMIHRPWLFALCVNCFSYGVGELLQML